MFNKWLENNGMSRQPMPDLKEQYSGFLVILGGGRCVWEDLAEFMRLFYVHTKRISCDTMCINDIGMHYPEKIQHWYSNDSAMLPKWKAARRPLVAKRDGEIHLHSCYDSGSVANVWPWPGHGSSALNACYTALALGYDRIVLCGVPMDDRGHYFDPPWEATNFVSEVKDRVWTNAIENVFPAGSIKSMSGRTKSWLGSPDERFFYYEK